MPTRVKEKVWLPILRKNITLAIIDENWKDHLRKMDDLKQSVQNASYEQKDPLLIYKFEAFELFKITVAEINKAVLSFLFKGELPQKIATNFRSKKQKDNKLNVLKQGTKFYRTSDFKFSSTTRTCRNRC